MIRVRIVSSLLILGAAVFLSGTNLKAKAMTLYNVEEVIDGDTILLENGRQVRLIGIDTTEVALNGNPRDCFSEEAKYYLTQILQGRQVSLTFTPEGSVDVFNRILAYVYRDDNIDINRHMIQEGYGAAYLTYPHRRFNEFKQVSATAQQQKRGYWGNICQGQKYLPVTTVTPSPPTNPINFSTTNTFTGLRFMPAGNKTTTYYTGN